MCAWPLGTEGAGRERKDGTWKCDGGTGTHVSRLCCLSRPRTLCKWPRAAPHLLELRLLR